jgi:methionine sulfoxide reductase heme-binding subunit
MSANYQPVLWNAQKKRYDWAIFIFVTLYFGLFSALTAIFYPEVTVETLIIRAAGTLALLQLHLILAIGPLSRLDKRFLLLLYNRRHLGVTMFVMAAVHGIFSIVQFHSNGNVNPLVSVFTSNVHYDSFVNFPFQVLGFFSLLILFLMTATSHDFWLHNLSPKVWKTLHMGVYGVYAMIVLHVMLGVIQLESSPWLTGALALGLLTLVSLHVAAGWKEVRKDNRKRLYRKDGFVFVCELSEIPDNRAKIITVEGESIAIFKYDNQLSAVSNVCKHQNGPLGEGKIVDGCITCPWHGYQYLPGNGSSPPPFKEKVATFDVKLEGKLVWVNPAPYPEGTARPPVRIPSAMLTTMLKQSIN